MSAETTTSAPSSIDELKRGMELRGTIKRIELYGAFVDIGVGTDGLLHISQLGKPNVRNVEDVVKEGDEVTAYILKVDKEEKRVALSLVKPPAVTWDNLKEGDQVTGKVVRLENFGVFVDIGAERPGMVHVSELADGFVKSPSDVVSVGQEVEARILKVNRKKRQIDLTMKSVEEPVATSFQAEEDEHLPTAMELALRRAMEQQEDAEEERGKKKQKSNRRAEEQDDILARTLRSQAK
ncbi:MAG: S1 RNA-binding domain-containing protein [Anaerolineae bacterium]|nr:S1 RNA-binding domain-containing protein [Anaerolineae bacterium]